MIWVVTPLCICTCHVHPPPLPPSFFLVPFLLCPSPQHNMRTLTEAVVLFDYEKQQDDGLGLKVGDIITDVKQVCAACCTCMYTLSVMLGPISNSMVSSAASWYHCMTCFGEYHYAGQLSDMSTRNTHAHFMPRAQEYRLK